MPIVLDFVTHPVTTKTRGLSYQFTPKHHGGQGHQGQAQWLPSLSLDEEFSVFDLAVEHDRGTATPSTPLRILSRPDAGAKPASLRKPYSLRWNVWACSPGNSERGS